MKFKHIARILCIFILCLCCFLLGAFITNYEKPITNVTNITKNVTNNTVNKTEKKVTKSKKKDKTKKKTAKKSNWSDTHEYMGTFTITAYSYDEGGGENYQTAGDYTPSPYYTVAVDPSIIALGTKLYIEDIGEVQAQDTGGAIDGYDIDLHIGYDDCESFGVQSKKVWIIK